MTYPYRYNFSLLMQNFHEAEEFFQASYEDKKKTFDETIFSLNRNNKEETIKLLSYFIDCIRSERLILEDFRIDLTDASLNSIQHLVDNIFQYTGIIQEFNDVFIITPHNLALEAGKILDLCISDLENFKSKISNWKENSNFKSFKKEFISILQRYSYKNQQRLQELNKYLYTKIEILVQKLKNQTSIEVRDQILELLFTVITIKGAFLVLGIFISPGLVFYSNLIQNSLIGLITFSNIPDFKDSREFKKWLLYLEEYFQGRGE
ncbi:MAG: hypothetical protein LAT82_04305 [Nanoarchaeota archaeon]|nr:hypothetical protein [Nanoarchaeota archaeon]